MNATLVVLCVLLYLLCGLVFVVAYIWNYRTQAGEARIGLMGLCWPVILLFDFILSVAAVFGGVLKKVANARKVPK